MISSSFLDDASTYMVEVAHGYNIETGFSGDDAIHSCFDLGAFLGETVQLSFDFGSDSSVNYPGWAIFRVSVGSDVVPVDGTTWSAVKGMFR